MVDRMYAISSRIAGIACNFDGTTDAEPSEVVITTNRDEPQTEFEIRKIIDLLDEYLTLHLYLNWRKITDNGKDAEEVRRYFGMSIPK